MNRMKEPRQMVLYLPSPKRSIKRIPQTSFQNRRFNQNQRQFLARGTFSNLRIYPNQDTYQNHQIYSPYPSEMIYQRQTRPHIPQTYHPQITSPGVRKQFFLGPSRISRRPILDSSIRRTTTTRTVSITKRKKSLVKMVFAK